MYQHSHPVRIYYEDTDVSGVVYHANYLKYFERAREHFLGPDEIVRLLQEEGIGFVVYKVEVTYKEGARLGDELEIRTRVELESKYRVIFYQDVWRADRTSPLVASRIDLVAVNEEQKLVQLPESVLSGMGALERAP
jgi:tol-pal system-associated acyl-CoA thioesterase